MTALLERTRCPACEGGATSTLYSRPFAHPSVWSRVSRRFPGALDRRGLTARRYEIARCDSCQLLFQRFVPHAATLRRLHTEWPPARAQPTALGLSAGARGPVLEVGERDDRLHQGARASGLEVVTVGLGHASLSPVSDWGIAPLNGAGGSAGAGFGLIRCPQVLERLPCPFETLRDLTSLLAPGGRLELSVPDATRWARGAQRPFWDAPGGLLFPLEQFNGFTAHALDVLARRLDLSLQDRAPAPWNRHARGAILYRALEPADARGRRRAA